MTRFQRLLAGSALAIAMVAPANAAVYLFTYTGDVTASWKLPSSPVPFDFDPDYFETDDILVTYNGVTSVDFVYFYTSALGGGFEIDGQQLSADGDELFTGTTDVPTFKLGTFITTATFPGGIGNGTLTISMVPEPANWAMLIAGFGLTGAVMRRRRNAPLVA